MKNRSSILCSLLAVIIFGLTSCSRDNEPLVNEVIVIDNDIVVTVSTSDFSISIDENPTEGQVIGAVSGTTNEGNVIFLITEQSPPEAFAIDSNTGELTVANASLFDFETNPTITGIVKVAHGTVFENSNITISLNDLEEAIVFDGDVYLINQQEVDDFGNNNYTEITGSLYIGLWSTPNNVLITDLSPLSTLTKIGYRLYVGHNDALTTLTGLDNINTIGSYLRILENDMLTDITALGNIQIVVDDLFILDNDNLTSLDGLDNITAVGTSLLIQQNYSLTNIDGLSGLTTVEDQLLINGNYSLLNLDGLSNLVSFGDYYIDGLHIFKNNSLMNIDGLLGLTIAMGGISISDCPSLTTLNGLRNITSTSSLSISECHSLTNLNGLNNIISVSESISINQNDLLMNIDALNNISSDIGSLAITKNSALTGIDGLQNISSVSYEVFIWSNNALTNLNGLSNVTSIGSSLKLYTNQTLTDLCGLQTLLVGGGLGGVYEVIGNAYNPSQQDVIDGNCSL